MADLELVGFDEDGEHLVLAAPGGARFRLRIDDELRAAVRRDRPRLEHLRASGAGSLPPREIQARVRAGLSAQEIAESAGIGIEQVRRYEGPVLAEREFIASRAQRTQVGRESDAPVLGELVTDRLAAREVAPESLVWDAFRPSDGPWTVRVDFDVAGSAKTATWSFDPATHALKALDDESRWLSETEVPDEVVPRRHLAPVRSQVFDVEAHREEPEEQPPADRTDSILHDLRSKRGVRQPAPEPEDDEEFEGFGPQQSLFESVTPHSEEASARVAASARSASSASSAAESHGEATLYTLGRSAASAEPAAPEEGTDTATAPGATDDEAVPPPLEKVKPGRKGRPKVPSWDEIVFGAKPE
ncbi:MAG: septation protein SepH [Cellulomonadaceae bacterium]